jgi:hypothetical protein
MAFHVSNHAKERKIGWELWAIFDSDIMFQHICGSVVCLIIVVQPTRVLDEKRRVRKKGIWPGDENSTGFLQTDIRRDFAAALPFLYYIYKRIS